MMAEYIKREDALRQCDRWIGEYTAWSIQDGIESIPAADVAPVVRCKDCKHFLPPTKAEATACSYIGGGMLAPSPNDFCSYGERRDVDGE